MSWRLSGNWMKFPEKNVVQQVDNRNCTSKPRKWGAPAKRTIQHNPVMSQKLFKLRHESDTPGKKRRGVYPTPFDSSRGGSRIFPRGGGGMAVYQNFCLLYCSSPSFFCGGGRGGFRLLGSFLNVRVQIILGLRSILHGVVGSIPPWGSGGMPPSQNFEKLKPLKHDFRDSEQLYSQNTSSDPVKGGLMIPLLQIWWSKEWNQICNNGIINPPLTGTLEVFWL